MDAWLQLVQSFGLAVVLLGFVGWGLVQVITWMAPRLDKVIAQAISTIDDIAKVEERVAAVVARVAAVEARIDALWDFHLRRGAAEAVAKGIATVNSPVTFGEESHEWLEPLAADLRNFYRALGSGVTDGQLAAAIEARWGEQLLRLVCLPNGLTVEACLLLAVKTAKQAGCEGQS